MDDSTKALAIDHVRYEIGRLAECYRRWSKLRPGVSTHTEVNDLVELTLLHTRTVLDFLECSKMHTKVRQMKARDDDVVAEDFGWPARSVPIDTSIKRRIDKEVAHISQMRCGLTTEQKKWRFDVFVPELLSHSLKFLEFIESEYPEKKRPNQPVETTPASAPH